MGRHPVKRHPYDGEMLTISEIEERSGMNGKAIRNRIKRGIPLDRPFQEREASGRYLYNGRMLTLAELARETGIHRQTLRNRLQRMGLSVEEAVQRKRFPHGTSKVVYHCSEEKKAMILKAWNRGERTVAEVMEMTGLPETLIGLILPIKELEADEAIAKREVLRRYGYGR